MKVSGRSRVLALQARRRKERRQDVAFALMTAPACVMAINDSVLVAIACAVVSALAFAWLLTGAIRDEKALTDAERRDAGGGA